MIGNKLVVRFRTTGEGRYEKAPEITRTISGHLMPDSNTPSGAVKVIDTVGDVWYAVPHGNGSYRAIH